MRKSICSISGLVLLFAVTSFPATTFATYSSYSDDGVHYGIREGSNKIPLGLDEKDAAKVARKVNKALDKDAPDKSVVDPGHGPCNDPSSGVVC